MVSRLMLVSEAGKKKKKVGILLVKEKKHGCSAKQLRETLFCSSLVQLCSSELGEEEY